MECLKRLRFSSSSDHSHEKQTRAPQQFNLKFESNQVVKVSCDLKTCENLEACSITVFVLRF